MAPNRHLLLARNTLPARFASTLCSRRRHHYEQAQPVSRSNQARVPTGTLTLSDNAYLYYSVAATCRVGGNPLRLFLQGRS